MNAMKGPALTPLICVVLLCAALVAAGCTSGTKPISTPTPTPVPETTIVPTATTASVTCGLSSCHGLDLACVPNPPEICTQQYTLGDRCRQYVHCESSGGSCTLVKDAGFSTCKACVEACQLRGGDVDLWAQSCEEKC